VTTVQHADGRFEQQCFERSFNVSLGESIPNDVTHQIQAHGDHLSNLQQQFQKDHDDNVEAHSQHMDNFNATVVEASSIITLIQGQEVVTKGELVDMRETMLFLKQESNNSRTKMLRE
jgi:hypothetical protein